MSRDFNSNNTTKTRERFLKRKKYKLSAYSENSGMGSKTIRDMNFVERMRYGHIDHNNNSVIPNENFIVNTNSGRVFDFVADAYSLMRLNCLANINKGALPQDSFVGNLSMVSSYKNPKLKHGEYLNDILQFYNETHIPKFIGKNIITSYESYVKNFFNFFLNNSEILFLTLTSWNISNRANILDTGLSFSFMDIPFDEDQRKIDEIIDSPYFEYFQNICLNMGFNIVHDNPNILAINLKSPAIESILGRYGIYNLDYLFNKRFIKTCILDNDIIYNKINIYYNKYAEKNYNNRVLTLGCRKTVSEYFTLEPIDITTRPYTELEELYLYCKIRNKEEGLPFSEQKVKDIYKKAKYFQKTVDNEEGIGYINSMFKDQVWNKDYGYHDLKAKLANKIEANVKPKAPPSNGGPSGGSTSGGGSSY